MQISCIIPIHNEAARIGVVLSAVSEIKEVGEIICVDDGSSDNSSEVIKNNFPKAKLIRHPANLGKSAAVADGLRTANFDTILLLDADLINLKSNEISKAIDIFEQNKLDCLLFNTSPMGLLDRFFRKIFRYLLTIAGNRIIFKKDLKKILTTKKINGYQVEIAQNYYLLKNHKKAAYMDISAKNISKAGKIGIPNAIGAEIKMGLQIVSYAGIIFFILQSLFFAKEKIISPESQPR